jgi:hypothetical protein
VVITQFHPQQLLLVVAPQQNKMRYSSLKLEPMQFGKNPCQAMRKSNLRFANILQLFSQPPALISLPLPLHQPKSNSILKSNQHRILTNETQTPFTDSTEAGRAGQGRLASASHCLQKKTDDPQSIFLYFMILMKHPFGKGVVFHHS